LIPQKYFSLDYAGSGIYFFDQKKDDLDIIKIALHEEYLSTDTSPEIKDEQTFIDDYYLE
jgi:hypothetical protein